MSQPLRQVQLLEGEPGLFPVSVVTQGSRKVEKSLAAHRTISEVAQEFGIPQHVLRFWETRFVQLKPLKRGGGRRYYRFEDVDLIRSIHSLLYAQGYTIKGAQKVLKNKTTPPQAASTPRKPAAKPNDDSRAVLATMLAELKALRALV